MINETGLNTTITKLDFYIHESNKQLDDIRKSLEALNAMYNSKTKLKMENKIERIVQESENINKNNENYVKLLRETVLDYRKTMASYAEKFETLGDIV